MFLLRPLQPRTSPSLRTPGRVLTPLGMTEALTFPGLSSVKEGRPLEFSLNSFELTHILTGQARRWVRGLTPFPLQPRPSGPNRPLCPKMGTNPLYYLSL